MGAGGSSPSASSPQPTSKKLKYSKLFEPPERSILFNKKSNAYLFLKPKVGDRFIAENDDTPSITFKIITISKDTAVLNATVSIYKLTIEIEGNPPNIRNANLLMGGKMNNAHVPAIELVDTQNSTNKFSRGEVYFIKEKLEPTTNIFREVSPLASRPPASSHTSVVPNNKMEMPLDEFLHNPDEETINKMFMENVPGLREKIPVDKYNIILNLLKKSTVLRYNIFVNNLKALWSRGSLFQLTDDEYSSIFNALFIENIPEARIAVHLRSLDNNVYGIYYIIELRPNYLYMLMVKRTRYGSNNPFEFHIVTKDQLNLIIKSDEPRKNINSIKTENKIYDMTTFLNSTTKGGRRRIHCTKTKKHRTKRRKTRKHN